MNTRVQTRYIRKAKGKSCCQENCLSQYTLQSIRQVRAWYHSDGSKSRAEEDKNALINEIMGSKVKFFSDVTQRNVVRYCIQGSAVMSVCASAMKQILGLSNWKWNNLKNGNQDVDDGTQSSSVRSRSLKEEKIVAFLHTIRQTFTEFLPNENAFDLPPNFTICELLRMFHVREEQYCITVSKTYFLRIWEVSCIILIYCVPVQYCFSETFQKSAHSCLQQVFTL